MSRPKVHLQLCCTGISPLFFLCPVNSNVSEKLFHVDKIDCAQSVGGLIPVNVKAWQLVAFPGAKDQS